MKVELFDRSSYKISSREYTDEGFLKVPGRVARTGVQTYLASELGLDGDPNREVVVYRPADEVFKDQSLQSYNTSDVTDDHPPKLIDSENYKKVTVGVIKGPGIRDGDYVKAELIIKDAKTIKLIESGKAELSAGYTAEYVPEKGITDSGEKYEFIQRDIKINHVAVVNKARAGSMARIFDNKKPEKNVMAKITLDNGRAVEVEDAVAAQVEDCIIRLTDKAKTATETADKAQAQVDSLTDEVKKLKTESSDEAVKARVILVGTTIDAARKLVGSEFTCDSVDPIEIKRVSLATLKSDMDFTDKSPAYIEAAFDMEMEKKEQEDEEEEEKKKEASDSHRQLANDMSTTQGDKKSGKVDFNDSISNGWKKTTGVES